MHISPRYIAFRLVLLCLLIGWAWWRYMPGDEPAPEPVEKAASTERDLILPALPAPAEVPPTVDGLALFTAVGEAKAKTATCGATGVTLTLKIGPTGLAGARIEGEAGETAAACVRDALTTIAWPAARQPAEASVELGG